MHVMGNYTAKRKKQCYVGYSHKCNDESVTYEREHICYFIALKFKNKQNQNSGYS